MREYVSKLTIGAVLSGLAKDGTISDEQANIIANRFAKCKSAPVTSIVTMCSLLDSLCDEEDQFVASETGDTFDDGAIYANKCIRDHIKNIIHVMLNRS